MHNKIHIGIDPGKGGAIVVFHPRDGVKKVQFPFIGDEYDIKSMSDFLKEYKGYISPKVHVVIEDVKALQKPFDSANWSLSGCKHILITLCTVHEIPFTLVSSKVWQKEMFQGIPEHRKPSKPDKNGKLKQGSLETKIMSELAAKRLFPTVDLFFPTEVKYYTDSSENRKKGIANQPIPQKSKVAHDGITDALMMAEYSRRKFD